MKIGIAADHAGFVFKGKIADALIESGFEICDFGAFDLEPEDDYPDFVIPLARSVAKGDLERGIAVCSSGIGAAIAANKVANARAAVVSDTFSARQGIEDDDMNMICFGSHLLTFERIWELICIFLNARFTGHERHKRRLDKIRQIEKKVAVK